MGRWRPRDERIQLGKSVAYLREKKGLAWRAIVDRLGLKSITQAFVYYKEHRKWLKAEEEIAKRRKSEEERRRRVALHDEREALLKNKEEQRQRDRAALKAKKLNFRQILEFSAKYNIERGYVWLYENGFKERVPFAIQERIEEGKLGIKSKKEGGFFAC